jgi:hypothetical protein
MAVRDVHAELGGAGIGERRDTRGRIVRTDGQHHVCHRDLGFLDRRDLLARALEPVHHGRGAETRQRADHVRSDDHVHRRGDDR